MRTETFQSISDEELAHVTGGLTIDLGSLSKSWTTIAGPLVTGILSGVGKLVGGILTSVGLGGLLGGS